MKGDWGDDETLSTIGDRVELGHIDYDDDRSVCSYNPGAEGPIVISVPFPFVNDKPQSVLLGDIVNDKITITNSTNEPVDLWRAEIYDSNPKGSFTLSIMEPPSKNSDEEYVRGFLGTLCLEDRVLQPEQTLNVWLSCKPEATGVHNTAVHFEVGDHVIERLVFIMVDDKISRSLVSKSPYRKDRKKKPLVADKLALNAYVPTQRPSREVNRGYRHRLNLYPILKEVREAVNGKQMPTGVLNGFSKENYYTFFRTLLNMEEIKLEEEMMGYDLECVSFGRKGQYLTLEVPGLAEKRPSLVVGDFVFAKLASNDGYDTTLPYQGYIHRVEAEEVHLLFKEDFHSRHAKFNRYNVQFNYNRVNMRKMYHAIEATGELETDFLFPSDSAQKRRIKPIQLGPISDMINEEQRISIKMITGCRGGPPYVIYGPPGTGKTVTVVEAIMQLYRNRKDVRLLVCAPSNSAADNILEILLQKLGKVDNIYDILRLNAVSRLIEDIKPEYLQFCYFENASFTCPPLKMLSRFRIIISTYMSSYSVYSEGLKRGHFSHIFLDEAGQASEPETMIPLSHLCARRTVVVLAGDPCQLGPVVQSKEAENNGMSLSFLARLFDCASYLNGDENYVTKLVRNYRCHPEILALPSELFYENQLVAMRTEDPSSAQWADLLPNKEFPVLFMGIQGCDEREGNNPSWFNRIEASKVVEIVLKLIKKGLQGEDIGVIAPYRQQVLKVSNILESYGCLGIKVGSVEQFQGQERKVIIISTVRSTIRHNEFDKIHYLGFLSNSRRFNVAITRARSLLIIIGNPHIIGKDTYWNLLLWRCVDNDSYQGCPLPEREPVTEDPPTQEEAEWGNEAQGDQASDNWQWKEEGITQGSHDGWNQMPYENNTIPNCSDDEWRDLACENNTLQGSNVNERGDLPCENNTLQEFNDDGQSDFPYYKDVPQGSKDKGGKGQDFEFDDGVSWA